MKVNARSEVGLIRSNNEDTFLVKTINDICIFLICDGMGGHKKGEVASQMAKDFVDNYDFSFDGKSDSEILDELKSIVNKANIEIYLKAKKSLDTKGMGTTFSLAVYYKDNIYFAHVGDSRIYILKNDNLIMISKDHTLINELAEKGIIIDIKKRTDLKRFITQALGASSIIEPKIGMYDAKKVDKILICSDGVTTYFDDAKLLEFIKKNEEPKKIVDEIIDSALNRGGKDNITCLIAEIGE